jgi:hypothetical protein
LVRNNFATIKKNKIVLKEAGAQQHATLVAGESDLGFLSSHLASFDFQMGRRTFESRYLSLPASDAKSLRLLHRKAAGKIESALGSLESVASRAPARHRRKAVRGHRVLITTTLSSETDFSESK